MALVNKAAERLKENHALEHVFSVEKPLRASVAGDFELIRGDDIIELRELSEVTEQLDRRIKFFPGFFIYVYRTSGIQDVELENIRESFAQLMVSEFVALVGRLEKKEAGDA